MSFDENDIKVLKEFLQDCTKVPERKHGPKGESDWQYMIKLLDEWFYNIAPRAEELLKLYEPLRQVKINCNQCNTLIEIATNKQIIKCPHCSFQNLVYRPQLNLFALKESQATSEGKT